MADNDLGLISAESDPIDQVSQLENRYLFNARRREERLKVVIHYITMITILLVFIVVTVVFLIRVSHFIMPDDYKWLTDEQLQSVDKFFFSGALGGIMTRHVGKLFNNA